LDIGPFGISWRTLSGRVLLKRRIYGKSLLDGLEYYTGGARMAKSSLASDEKIGVVPGETPQRGPGIEEVDSKVSII